MVVKRGEFLKELCGVLAAGGVPSPAREARILLETQLGLTRTELIRYPEVYLPGRTADRIRRLAFRRAAGEPLQYLLGRWEFYGREFFVTPAVLIPRPETEQLVEVVLRELKGKDKPAVADFGSGSGAIAVTLSLELPGSRVWAIEKSKRALKILQKNIISLGAKGVTAMWGDMLCPALPQKMDAIVSNPPYITDSEMLELSREVAHEPKMALRGGEDGLRFYRALAQKAPRFLRRDGFLAMEIGAQQGETVPQLLREKGWQEITLYRDYAELPRVVAARAPRLPD